MFARELEECCDTHKKLTENVSYVFGIGGVYSVQYSVNTSISPSWLYLYRTFFRLCICI